MNKLPSLPQVQTGNLIDSAASVRASDCLTVDDVAGRLGVPVASVVRWIDCGRLAALTVDGVVGVPVSEVRRVLRTGGP